MVDLRQMYAAKAIHLGYKTNNYKDDDDGYEVTYPDGYKS